MSLLSFLTVICCAATSLQTNTNAVGRYDVLKSHIELHQYHCGEAATCGSNEHVEPSEFVIPVPCCIPCSCLPSCVEQRNCCPWSVNGTRGVATTTESELDYPDPEKENDLTYDEMVLDENDAKIWNKTDESTQEQRGLGRAFTENRINFNKGDSGSLNMNHTENANEKCIRPQVNYELNRQLDSQAYMMVATCPNGFKDKLVVDKCIAEKRNSQTSWVDVIPVTSNLSGLTYKNKYCLLCNEELQQDHITEWRAEIVSLSAFGYYILYLNPDAILDNFIEKRILSAFSNIHFVPTENDLAKRCDLYDITSCNQTGLWDDYDELAEKVCMDGYQLPIMASIDTRLTFKNIGCLRCNLAEGLVKSRLECGFLKIKPGLKIQSLSLNLRSVFIKAIDTKALKDVPYIEQDVLRQFPTQSCPAGMLYIQGRCRIIICPTDHYALMNQCVPLYDAIRDLDLNMKIAVTPSQPIPGDIFGPFAGNLKQVADEVLDATISLDRYVSLWYLPRSNTNPTQYYLLDIFLYSPSNVIEYSSAIGQIKQFIFKLKTAKFSVLEAANIKLDFQFKYCIEQERGFYADKIKGKTLKPLMETKGYTLPYVRPHITISEVYWCFRAAIEAHEIDYFRIYIRIKATDKIVFKGQFEIRGDQAYLCIDHFLKQKTLEIDFQNTQNDKAMVVNDVTTEIVIDSERGLILTVSVIAIILILIIRYRMKNKRQQQETQESDTSDRQQPSDDIELDVIDNQNKDGHI